MVEETPKAVAIANSNGAEMTVRREDMQALSTQLESRSRSPGRPSLFVPWGPLFVTTNLSAVPNSLAGRGRDPKMRGMLLSTTVLFALAAAAAAPAAGRPSLQLVVHDETRPPLSPAIVRDMLKEVRVVWHAYIDIEAVAGSGLGTAITDDVLTLVISDTPARDAAVDSLGWIEFVDGEPLRTINVSRGAAVALCDRTVLAGRPLGELPAAMRNQFVARALGRAAAHEIGHYLLASKAHGATGLMRAHFATVDLLERSPRNFRLTSAELGRRERRFSSYRLARRALLEPPAQ